MFCNQCEQTANGTGCTLAGVCGKQADTADLQDTIIYALRGLALVCLAAREKSIIDPSIDRLSVKAAFSTLTNVNFDNTALTALLKDVLEAKDSLARKAGFTTASGPASLSFASALTHAEHRVDSLDHDPDIQSVQQLLLYGIKGVAAYADHAAILGKTDPELFSSLYSLLAAGFDGKNRSLSDWVQLVMNCGEINIRAMELLDAGNTETFGIPVPTDLALGPVSGKAILVSGHDLKDLYDLLVQTKDTGIKIYTHGEMLPAHGYPGLKKFSHLAGHYGTAWQNQQKELVLFPGAVLFTTNCIQKPHPSYERNVFTTGLVGWPGVQHVTNGDFAPVIARALELPGFSKADVDAGNKTRVMTGFARDAVLGVADTVVSAVKSGAIRHFFLVGGCDGAKPGRNYYTEFVEKAPKDTIILTLACGKFRFFDKDLGTVGGIPRLLDVGQCNDAYSAVKIALALTKAFDCGINDLPLSFIISWYEQKAVAVLLSLLYLGVKNIHLGPTLPAFITPNILSFLVDNFAIKPIGNADDDLKAILG